MPKGTILPPIKSIPKIEKIIKKPRTEKLSKVGNNSRIPAPIKPNSSNISSLNGSGNFSGTFSDQHDDSDGLLSNGKSYNDNEILSNSSTLSINKNEDTNKNHDENGNKTRELGDDSNENVLEDSLDGNSLGIFLSSPNILSRNSDFDNTKEREIILDYKNICEKTKVNENGARNFLKNNFINIDDVGNNDIVNDNEKIKNSPNQSNDKGKNKMRNKNNIINYDNDIEIVLDENKSHVSDLSSEENSAFSPGHSPHRFKDGKKKRNKPFKALQPLVLKPFISIPLDA